MEHVNFNFQILPILIGLSGVIVLALLRNRIPINSFLRSFWLSGFIFFGLYFLLMLTVTIYDTYVWIDYQSYDLDKSGNIEGFERTEEWEKAMKNVVNDTARSLAFITTAIISFIFSLFVLIISLIRSYLKRKNNKEFNVA